MKNLLFLISVLTIGSTVSSNMLKNDVSNHQSQIINRLADRTFVEEAIVTAERTGSGITPSSEISINVNISSAKINELNNDKTKISAFVQNLTYSDGTVGTVMTNPNFLPDFKINLAANLNANIAKIADNTSNIGCVVALSVNWSFNGIVSIHATEITAFVDYTPASESYNYDEIEKYYKFLAHDVLKVDISQHAWKWINSDFQHNATTKILKGLFSNFPQYDKSGAGGSITFDDLATLATASIQNITKIANQFQQSQTNGVILTTNTEGDDVTITSQ